MAISIKDMFMIRAMQFPLFKVVDGKGNRIILRTPLNLKEECEKEKDRLLSGIVDMLSQEI